MFRKDIEKIYTDTLTEYINKGYRINSNTMSGSQGEIAKIDLTNDKEIIRIMLNRGTNFGGRYWTDYIKLTVGRNTDKLRDDYMDIIWNEHLEIISEISFYKIGHNGDYYGTKEEAIEAMKKSYDRIKNRVVIRNTEIILPDTAKEIVLPFLRKQYKCKSIRIDEINKVSKIFSDGKPQYYIVARGRSYLLK